MKKRIVITANTAWYLYNFRLHMMKELRMLSYEIIAVAPKDKYSDNLIEEGFMCYDIKIDGNKKNPILDLFTLFSFYKIYRLLKPDIILQYTIKPNIYGTLAASYLRIPTINNIAGLGTLFITNNFFTKLAKKLYRFSLKKATAVFFQNFDDMNIFISEKIVNQSQATRIPGSGVNVDKFHPEAKRSNGIFTFVLIARMLWDKGVGDLVKAGEILHNKGYNFKINLIGFTDNNNPRCIKLETLTNWSKKNYIKFLGHTDNVKKHLAESDCCVLPSYYREGVPRTLLEAASMAKPIITTDNVGCRDVVDDCINGYICRVKDPIDLSNKMEKILNLTKYEVDEMGQNSRDKIIREFDEKIVIKCYTDKIHEILSFTI